MHKRTETGRYAEPKVVAVRRYDAGCTPDWPVFHWLLESLRTLTRCDTNIASTNIELAVFDCAHITKDIGISGKVRKLKNKSKKNERKERSNANRNTNLFIEYLGIWIGIKKDICCVIQKLVVIHSREIKKSRNI